MSTKRTDFVTPRFQVVRNRNSKRSITRYTILSKWQRIVRNDVGSDSWMGELQSFDLVEEFAGDNANVNFRTNLSATL